MTFYSFPLSSLTYATPAIHAERETMKALASVAALLVPTQLTAASVVDEALIHIETKLFLLLKNFN